MGHITNDTGKDIYTKNDLKDLLDTIHCLTYDINEEQHYIEPSQHK